MTSTRKRTVLLALTFQAMASVTASAAATPATANPALRTVKVGTSPVMSTSGVFLGKELGFFAAEGLNVDIQIFKSSGAPMSVPLASGDLDVGAGNISSGTWNEMNSGVALRLVADKGHIAKGHSYIGLLVRQDHIASGRYKTLKDLKGFKMGLTALDGVSQQIAADRFLQKAGLSMKDVTFVKMAYSEMNVALATKSLDATVQLEPYVAKAELDGIAKKVADVYDVYPDQQSAAILYSQKFMKDRPDDAVKFMIGYLQGVRAYELAFTKGENRANVIAALKKYIDLEPATLWDKMIPVGLNPDGYLNTTSLLSDMQWYRDNKYVQKLPDIKNVVDHSFVEKALAKIGPFEKK
jgi:NitT/TauT family transport system substrate-binding protein